MVANRYDGVYVPREAVRFNALGEKGVYVKLGQGIVFKKLDVVYEGDNYLLSANSGDPEYVLLYDDIIVDGISKKDEAYIGILYASDDVPDETEETTTETTVALTVGETTKPEETTATSEQPT